MSHTRAYDRARNNVCVCTHAYNCARFYDVNVNGKRASDRVCVRDRSRDRVCVCNSGRVRAASVFVSKSVPVFSFVIVPVPITVFAPVTVLVFAFVSSCLCPWL